MSSSASTSGVLVSLGTMEFGRYASEQQALAMVRAFLAAGYSELDTASMYADGESERILGRLPADVRAQSVIHTRPTPGPQSRSSEASATALSRSRPAPPSPPSKSQPRLAAALPSTSSTSTRPTRLARPSRRRCEQ